jgi:hemolysin III
MDGSRGGGVAPPEPAAARDRRQSLGEEIANAVSHGVGFVAALLVAPLIILNAIPHGAAAVVGASLFAATVPLLYLTSTLYHSLADNRAKRVFQVLDHSAIYLLIAGTYTPFLLGPLRGPWGWSLLGTIWGLALLGVVFKSVRGMRYPGLSTALYVAMGWLVLVAVRPLWLHVPASGLAWLAAGGVAYTAGVLFYAADHRRYAHFVWHLFVMLGTACHVVAVMGYGF